MFRACYRREFETHRLGAVRGAFSGVRKEGSIMFASENQPVASSAGSGDR